MHSTNYFNTLIRPAEDCAAIAKIPDKPGSVASLQYEYIATHPYEYTSDDVLSGVAAQRKDISEEDYEAFRSNFFAKGQPCFRASPLTKTHGWAIHANGEGLVALITPDTPKYTELADNPDIKVVSAMRNKRA